MKRTLIKILPTVVISTFILVSEPVWSTGTTHIWAPSTDVQAYKLWHITGDFYLPSQKDAIGNRLPTVTNIGLTVGILPFKKINAEIGFDHKSGLGIIDNYPLYGNFKVGLPENTFGKFIPALAAGIFDIGTKKDRTDYDVIYSKLAKSINVKGSSLGRFSLGYFAGNKKLLLDDKGQKDNSGLLIAWERTMSEISDKLWICMEYMGTKSAYGSFNFGASWKFAPNVALIGGYDLYNNTDLPDTFTLQVDIDI
jgi:hypothetical protein